MSPPEYFRPPPPPPSTHCSTDLASNSGSPRSLASWNRDGTYFVSDLPDSDDGSDWDSDTPRKRKFPHGPLSTIARHEDSDVGETQVKQGVKHSRKEIAAREKKRKEKALKKRDLVHQIFASGAFEEDPKNKVLPPKEKTGLAKLFEMKSTCWKAPDKKGKKVEPPLVVVEKKETEEERKKREDEEDQAEIKKAVEAKWAKILEKEDIRYKKRIDERRYNAFMNEDLSRDFQYPWQYSSYYPATPSLPQTRPGWLDPTIDTYSTNPNNPFSNPFQDPQLSELDNLMNNLGHSVNRLRGGGTPDGLVGLSGRAGGMTRQMLDAQMRTVKTKIEDLADRIRRLQAAGHPDNAPNVRSGLTNLMQLQEEYHRLGQEWALASR